MHSEELTPVPDGDNPVPLHTFCKRRERAVEREGRKNTISEPDENSKCPKSLMKTDIFPRQSSVQGDPHSLLDVSAAPIMFSCLNHSFSSRGGLWREDDCTLVSGKRLQLNPDYQTAIPLPCEGKPTQNRVVRSNQSFALPKGVTGNSISQFSGTLLTLPTFPIEALGIKFSTSLRQGQLSATELYNGLPHKCFYGKNWVFYIARDTLQLLSRF